MSEQKQPVDLTAELRAIIQDRYGYGVAPTTHEESSVHVEPVELLREESLPATLEPSEPAEVSVDTYQLPVDQQRRPRLEPRFTHADLAEQINRNREVADEVTGDRTHVDLPVIPTPSDVYGCDDEGLIPVDDPGWAKRYDRGDRQEVVENRERSVRVPRKIGTRVTALTLLGVTTCGVLPVGTYMAVRSGPGIDNITDFREDQQLIDTYNEWSMPQKAAVESASMGKLLWKAITR